MRVLVTGAVGVSGFNVSRHLLARGDTVLGIDSLNDYYDVRLRHARLTELDGNSANYKVGFAFKQVDFSDHFALDTALGAEHFDRIVHLGAQAGFRYSVENPRAYLQANLAGHLNMIEIGRNRRVEHLVYASSSSVYGGNDALPFRVEDRVDQPLLLYAASHQGGRRADERTYARLYRLPQTGLRFFTVYGPWGAPTWRCGCLPRQSSMASRSMCSARGGCAATSPISTTWSPGSLPALTVRQPTTAPLRRAAA